MPKAQSYDVSIVIHAADAAADLEDCVRAAKAQEGVAVEVVIVDDVSTDETPVVANRLAVGVPDVRVVSRLIERNATAAKMDGLRAAQGRFACLLEAADRLRPNVLAALVAAAGQGAATIVAPSVALVRAPGTAEAAGQGRVPRLERPMACAYGAPGIVDAIFSQGACSPRVRGRLFDARLLARTLAEVGDVALVRGEDEALSFMAGCLAERLQGCPDVVAADLAVEDDPVSLTPALARELCRSTEAVSQVVEFLDEKDLWQAYGGVWMDFVQGLAHDALGLFPLATDPSHWSEVAGILLASWGPGIVGNDLLARGPADGAVASVALAASPTLERRAEKPGRALVLVGRSVAPATLAATLESLRRRIASVVLVAEEGAELPAGASAEILPSGLSPLARCRMVEDLLERNETEAAVFFASSPSAASDELCARSLGFASGLVMDGPLARDASAPLALDLARLLDVAGAVALSHATASAERGDGALWQLLGTRATTLDGLFSQLTLASASTLDADERLLAARLIQTARALQDALATERARSSELERENDAQRLVIAARQVPGPEVGASAAPKEPTHPAKGFWRRRRA